MESFCLLALSGFDSLAGEILPVANEQLRNANEGLPLVVSCE